MTADQFRAAVAVAMSPCDLSNVCDIHLHGCGLPSFREAITTIEAVAVLLRWQCQQLNGGWDMDEMQNIKDIARRKFRIVGEAIV